MTPILRASSKSSNVDPARSRRTRSPCRAPAPARGRASAGARRRAKRPDRPPAGPRRPGGAVPRSRTRNPARTARALAGSSGRQQLRALDPGLVDRGVRRRRPRCARRRAARAARPPRPRATPPPRRGRRARTASGRAPGAATRVRGAREDAGRRHELAVDAAAAPQAGERERPAAVDRVAEREPRRRPSSRTSATRTSRRRRTRQCRSGRAISSANGGLSAAVSARALIGWKPLPSSRAHGGTSPQRTVRASLPPSSLVVRGDDRDRLGRAHVEALERGGLERVARPRSARPAPGRPASSACSARTWASMLRGQRSVTGGTRGRSACSAPSTPLEPHLLGAAGREPVGERDPRFAPTLATRSLPLEDGSSLPTNSPLDEEERAHARRCRPRPTSTRSVVGGLPVGEPDRLVALLAHRDRGRVPRLLLRRRSGRRLLLGAPAAGVAAGAAGATARLGAPGSPSVAIAAPLPSNAAVASRPRIRDGQRRRRGPAGIRIACAAIAGDGRRAAGRSQDNLGERLNEQEAVEADDQGRHGGRERRRERAG